LDVDLEDAFHVLLLQVLFESAERCRPGLGVLAHPPVVDELNGDRVQEMQLLPTASPGRHQASLFEHAQVLHHTEARHGETPLERCERLPILLEELIEETATSG